VSALQGGREIGTESRDVRDDARRWIDDAAAQLAYLQGVLRDNDRLRERVDVAEREQERLRGLAHENEQLHARLGTAELECERLREQVARLREENARHDAERLEVADQLSEVMNQVLLRLRAPNR
jgi:hypothetical protein